MNLENEMHRGRPSTGSWRALLAAAGTSLAAAACASDHGGAVQVGERAEDLSLSVVPTGIETAGALGQGRDAITEEFRGDCVRSATTVNIPLQEANLRFDSSLLQEEASEMLGFSVDAKARFKLVSGSARARFSRSLTNKSLSIGMFYVADYNMGVERLDQANLEWTVDPAAPDFINRCGDHVLQQRERGGQLFLLYRIDFASSEAKQEFEGSVGVNFAAGEVNASVNRASSRFANRASVHVEAFQVGGDVTRLSSILNAGGPDANAGRVIVECNMQNLAPCSQFMQNAIAYASDQSEGSFSQTLRENPADRAYLFKDWGLLGVPVPQRRVPATVKATRTILRELFDGQVELADRLALLRGGNIFVHAELRAQLDTYSRKVQSNIAILSDAIDPCYDFLLDPSDADQVEACTTGVDDLEARGYDPSLTMDELTVPPPSLGARVIERTDPSGRLTVAVFERQADTAAQNFRDFPVSVTPDYVVIGGGAMATNQPQGNLLTASYPSGDGWTWLASSKDHFLVEPIRLRAYAIGLKVAGMSREELKAALLVRSAASAAAQSPDVSVSLPSEYAMLGGGFFVDYRGVGNLGVASYPENAQTWRAKSKAHNGADAATLNAYAIGILRSLPGIDTITTSINSLVSSTQAHPSTFVQAPAGTLLVGCGASAVATAPCTNIFACFSELTRGQLLWKLRPDATLTACDVGSKDHRFSSAGTITGYALGISAE